MTLFLLLVVVALVAFVLGCVGGLLYAKPDPPARIPGPHYGGDS